MLQLTGDVLLSVDLVVKYLRKTCQKERDLLFTYGLKGIHLLWAMVGCSLVSKTRQNMAVLGACGREVFLAGCSQEGQMRRELIDKA